MKVGKLSSEDLENYVFKNITKKRSEVLQGSDIGLDTAVIDFSNNLVVISTDPITGATKDIGKLAVNVSCNDVSCEGAEPVAILMSVLLPPDAELEELEEIVKDANEECEKLNLDIVGGHTEVTDAVNRIVVTTTVLGKVKKEKLPKISLVKEGDVICISKFVGIEGSTIIYKEKFDELKSILDEDDTKELKDFDEMISVVEESKVAQEFNVKYMHDITEGGLFGALYETSKVIGKGIEVQLDLVPIKKSTLKLANHFEIDPYRLISSGSMIMIFEPEDYEKLKSYKKESKCNINVIGTITKSEDKVLIKSEKDLIITEATVDELYKIY